MQQLFVSGKMAMNIAGPYSLPEYVDAGVDYGVVSLPSFGDEHTTIAGPDTWAIFDNGPERTQAALEFMDWFCRARAAAALDQRGRQPAADQRRQGRPRLRRLRRRASRASTSSSRTRDLARTRATIPEYPQISQAMGKAVASVLYGEAEPERGAEHAVDTANQELQVPGP